MSTPVRLNKVLKELNISLDRAVDSLVQKKSILNQGQPLR